MNENVEFGDRDLVLEFYFAVRDFLYIYDRLDDNYRIEMTFKDNKPKK